MCKILTNYPQKAGLMWVDPDEEKLECDFCDEMKPLAHISSLSRDVICICKDCLKEIINEFD
jgi:hypothetical protein